eukprot:TRINITY_DN912_c0_g1_i1.p1 TRINITY_DN912_c0_g1~~TRINITY_DN912_c0_g1_i1.p1  ORF type:complete len:591 (+),score=148.95 TRINITY_DN912_c0_g1_i1:326-2098(+)
MFRIGGLRVGKHFSASIFLICVLEMVVYINICMTEEVMNSERHTTESYLERDKNNLVLWATPSPNSRAEELHKRQMEEAQEALKRAALTKEIEREQLLSEKNNEQLEVEGDVQRPLQQRNHFSERTSEGEASEGEANGNAFAPTFKKRTLLSSLDSAVDATYVEILVSEISSMIAPAIDNTISLAQVLFHHGIQLFCLWKLRKVVLRNLSSHLPFEEIYALLKFNLRKQPQIASNTSDNARYCFGMLEKVNGSFAAMIIALPDEVREATCVFYLILRALSTIESDRSVSIEQRKEALLDFHLRLLDRSWSTRSFGQGYNKELLANFDRVTELYWQQKGKYRDIIKDSTRRMGQGMSEFLDKEYATKQDYEMYCHYVAGLVGISLTAMIGCGMEEGTEATKAIQRANNLGLFLQKTNVIYESFNALNSPSGRIMIPQEIWAKFVDDVYDLKDPQFAREATGCLNELVIDAFNHLHSSLEYMFFIKDPAVFNFFAIPLVLAAATLADCFGKQESFLQGTPLRKGLAARIFLEVNDFKSICSYFLRFIDQMDRKIKKDDPNADGLRDSIMSLKNYIDDMRWVDEMTPHKRAAC